jgi:delta 1-pyrroline-5-carboxylate dehydrogenase
MRKNLLIVSLLAAALTSGAAFAQGTSGGGMSGTGQKMGGGSKSLQKGKDEDCKKAKQSEQAKGSQGASEETAKKELEQERERLQLQQENAGTNSSGDPAKARTEEQIRQENAVQP